MTSVLVSLNQSFDWIRDDFLAPFAEMISDQAVDVDGLEYGAVRFTMGGNIVLFRRAKHTPKKVGQFVTLYKRPTPDGEIAPFDQGDGVCGVLVLVNEGERLGLFVFDAAVLTKMGVFSKDSSEGKRAIRVYAPWTNPEAAQAKKTKEWQCKCFIELTNRDDGKPGLHAAMKRLCTIA